MGNDFRLYISYMARASNFSLVERISYYNKDNIMNDEQIFGEYVGIVDLVGVGELGPWALLDAEKVGDTSNTPMLQIGLTKEQFDNLKEDDDVKFQLTPSGDNEAYMIYNDEGDQPEGVYIINFEKV